MTRMMPRKHRVAGDEDRNSVNYLMVKPFAVYALNPHWDAIYMP